VFVLLLLLGLLGFERAKDPYQRTFQELTVHGTNVTAVAVTPKAAKTSLATVIYLHGSRGRALGNGTVLRQFADAGFAAVTLEYSQSSQADFNAELLALHTWVQQQPWADTNRIAWVGFSLGAQRMLEYHLTQPGQSPHVLARVGGGLVGQLRDEAKAGMVKPKQLGPPQVLLFHGGQDRVFPMDDMEKVGSWLRSQGSSVSAWVLPQAEHAFGMDREWVMRCMVDEVAAKLAVPRTSRRPAGSLQTAKVALAAILLCGAWWLGPKLFRAQAGESKLLRQMAIGALGLALLVTAYHLLMPRLLSGGHYATWFQHALATDAEREDFRWLAAQPDYQLATCHDLMQQVRLAHFRKSFLYQKLDADMFRNFVLLPKLSADDIPDMGWRWPLWLELYPKIRKCAQAEEAVIEVVRAVREKLGLPKNNAQPEGIMAAWTTETANKQAYHYVLVAALRAAGVAARLDDSGRAEFWTGRKWQPVVDKEEPFDIRVY
jgi:dienelactone hydrolase